jgi:hypothetical protein
MLRQEWGAIPAGGVQQVIMIESIQKKEKAKDQ